MSLLHHYHLEKLTDIHSKLLGRDTIVDIFLPFQYEKGHKHYPLLMLNDGQDSETIQLKQTLEKLTLTKEIEDIIVVAVHAGDRMQEYGVANKADYKKRGARAKNYTKFIITELIPYLHYRYSIFKNSRTMHMPGSPWVGFQRWILPGIIQNTLGRLARSADPFGGVNAILKVASIQSTATGSCISKSEEASLKKE